MPRRDQLSEDKKQRLQQEQEQLQRLMFEARSDMRRSSLKGREDLESRLYPPLGLDPDTVEDYDVQNGPEPVVLWPRLKNEQPTVLRQPEEPAAQEDLLTEKDLFPAQEFLAETVEARELPPSQVAETKPFEKQPLTEKDLFPKSGFTISAPQPVDKAQPEVQEPEAVHPEQDLFLTTKPLADVETVQLLPEPFDEVQQSKTVLTERDLFPATNQQVKIKTVPPLVDIAETPTDDNPVFESDAGILKKAMPEEGRVALERRVHVQLPKKIAAPPVLSGTVPPVEREPTILSHQDDDATRRYRPEAQQEAVTLNNKPVRPRKKTGVIIAVAAAALLLIGLAGVYFFGSHEPSGPMVATNNPNPKVVPGEPAAVPPLLPTPTPDRVTVTSKSDSSATDLPPVERVQTKEPVKVKSAPNIETDSLVSDEIILTNSDEAAVLFDTTNSIVRYKVISKAYFHNKPDESTRRKAFIIHWNNAVLTPLDEKEGFIYIVFTNHLGQTSKGWLLKKDLRTLN